ncbi:hypothetical protein STANM309S_02687 [Streptomyces tanashiensis]
MSEAEHLAAGVVDLHPDRAAAGLPGLGPRGERLQGRVFVEHDSAGAGQRLGVHHHVAGDQQAGAAGGPSAGIASAAAGREAGRRRPCSPWRPSRSGCSCRSAGAAATARWSIPVPSLDVPHLRGRRPAGTCSRASNWPRARSTTRAGSTAGPWSCWSGTPRPIPNGPRRPWTNSPASAWPPWSASTASSPAPPPPGPTPSACPSSARPRCSTRSPRSGRTGSRVWPRPSPAAGGSTRTSSSPPAGTGSPWSPSRASTGRPARASCGSTSLRGGTVLELDANALTPEALCDALVAHDASALLLLVGSPEPAVPFVRAVRDDRRLAELLIGAPAGQPEFAGWAASLGEDCAGIPFLRYLPERLGPLGDRVAKELRERLGEAPSFVAFEGWDTVTVLAAAVRSHGTDRAAVAESWSRIAVEGTRGQFQFPRRPGVAVDVGTDPGRRPGPVGARPLPGPPRGLREGAVLGPGRHPVAEGTSASFTARAFQHRRRARRRNHSPRRYETVTAARGKTRSPGNGRGGACLDVFVCPGCGTELTAGPCTGSPSPSTPTTEGGRNSTLRSWRPRPTPSTPCPPDRPGGRGRRSEKRQPPSRASTRRCTPSPSARGTGSSSAPGDSVSMTPSPTSARDTQWCGRPERPQPGL